MKTPSGELFKLIQSLDTQEKVYFKKSALRMQRSKRYVNLFDLLDTMSVYDENKLKKKLKDKNLIRNLKFIKSYTYDAILKTLEKYHSNDSVNAVLGSYVQQIEFLINKRLFYAAYKIIAKAEKLALDNDCRNYLLMILDWRYKIAASQFDMEKVNNYIREGYLNDMLHLDNYKNIIEYKKLYAQQMSIIVPQAENLDKKTVHELRRLLQHPLLKNKSHALSHSARELYFRILSKIYFGLQDWEKCYRYIKQFMQIFEQKISSQQEKMGAYIESLGVIMTASAMLGKKDEVLSVKNKAERFIATLPNLCKSMGHYLKKKWLLNEAEDLIQ